MERSWLSAHVPYRGPAHAFLLEAIGPCMARCTADGLAAGAFFVLGPEHPHVRLRLRERGQVPRLQLEHRLEQELGAHPIVRAASAGVEQVARTFEFVPYVPEIARYGGELGVRIAEWQFEASSRAVLAALRTRRTTTYPSAMGTAIQLHLGLVAGMQMQREEARAFFSFAARWWIDLGSKSAVDGSDAPRLRADRLEAFESRLEREREALAQVSPLFALAHDESALEATDGWFALWVQRNARLGAWLREALRTGRLLPPSVPSHLDPIADQADRTGVSRRLWPILASYLHMTNNRLGILNPDEPYQAYLIASGLARE